MWVGICVQRGINFNGKKLFFADIQFQYPVIIYKWLKRRICNLLECPKEYTQIVDFFQKFGISEVKWINEGVEDNGLILYVREPFNIQFLKGIIAERRVFIKFKLINSINVRW